MREVSEGERRKEGEGRVKVRGRKLAPIVKQALFSYSKAHQTKGGKERNGKC